MLTVKLLGQFETLVDGDAPPELHIRSAHKLLALLCVHHDQLLRASWVAETLWPDLCSLDVLAQSRSQLKKVLGQEWRRLEIGRQNLLFRVDEADVDLVDFARGLGRVERGESGAIKQ